MHLTLGIFLKIFKLFDRECRRLDYRLRHQNDDEELEKIVEDLFLKEQRVFDFEEGLIECTSTFLYQLSQLADDDIEGRTNLENTFTAHKSKVEAVIQKIVS